MSKYRELAAALVAQMTLEEKVGQTLYNAPAVERPPITGGTRRYTALQGRERQRYFPRQSALQPPLTRIWREKWRRLSQPRPGPNTMRKRKRGTGTFIKDLLSGLPM